jgi:hypothetical protein
VGNKIALLAGIGLVAATTTVDIWAAEPSLQFMGKTYRLASYNQEHSPMWEFVEDGESVGDWKTLVTILERPDVKTREELDRLAEGIRAAYKSRGSQILMAKTMQKDSGEAFNYIVVAFEEPDKKRFELDFVKVELAAKNAAVVIYGVRVTDPKNYLAKAKQFLNRDSQEVGRAVGEFATPDVSKLPRKVF